MFHLFCPRLSCSWDDTRFSMQPFRSVSIGRILVVSVPFFTQLFLQSCNHAQSSRVKYAIKEARTTSASSLFVLAIFQSPLPPPKETVYENKPPG